MEPKLRFITNIFPIVYIGFALSGCIGANRSIIAEQPATLTDWPAIHSAIAKDAEMEVRIRQMVAEMSLQQKIGQMTQPEIKSISPADVSKYYIGSVLNGGGSWPNGNKHAPVSAWLDLADRYYVASISTDMPVKVPLIWGTDAVHGHNNVFGATMFPHNIGLGAAHDTSLIKNIGEATGKAVRATGINWVFAPTLAVVRNDRWGRTYESFSEDGKLVGDYGGAYVEGLQGTFHTDANVVATAKHFIGDGGTDQGKDQGINLSSKADMLNIHARGYYSALAAGVQTVMASYHSWNDIGMGVDYGKMHGTKALLTDALKNKMGFDGFIVSDWNAIAQVPGCVNASCPQAINAGIDMVMVPDDWKAFIANTIAQVNNGEIPISRIDDAVTRILRVKIRAGLFDKKPSQGAYAGSTDAVQSRALARHAVRESLVLLKNNGGILPLARDKRILVVGKSADSMSNQTGGWSLTWQGMDNVNSDFPAGDTILAGIKEMVGNAQVVYSQTARDVDPSQFDAVIAVIGETPYAETSGDITASNSLLHTSRYPEDLAVLKAVSGKGRPVITVFLSGRPLFANDLLNLSDAFVAAWLPGTEGKGVADMLFKDNNGKVNYDFRGTLSFSWPKSACQDSLNHGDVGYAPQFALGYGLNYASRTVEMSRLNIDSFAEQCAATTELSIFSQSDRSPYKLYVSAAANRWSELALGADLNATLSVPADAPVIRVKTVDVNRQQDAKHILWQCGEARIYARSEQAVDMRSYAAVNAALQFDTIVSTLPKGTVTMSMGCTSSCSGTIDLTQVLKRSAVNTKRTIKIPLDCFSAQGANLERVDMPFSVLTDQPFGAAFANIQIRAGAAKDADALTCAEVGTSSASR
ncbi:MAG: glycoside hydrolase family 3 protein [Methylotenera sp.]